MALNMPGISFTKKVERRFRMIKVLVVDDSIFMRKMISQIIDTSVSMKVIGTAKNGKEAVEQTKILKPDVITMDIEMPVMNGIEALSLIMKVQPTPVIMISSLTHEGAEATMNAFQMGAIDFVTKPSGSISFDISKLKNEIQNKIRAADGCSLRTNLVKPIMKPQDRSTLKVNSPLIKGIKSMVYNRIVAIGTSTGGPKALHTLLQSLSPSLNAPVVIVQHMPPKFTASLAKRLNDISDFEVMEAEHHQELSPGCVYIAPGSHHMEVESLSGKYRIVLHDKPNVNGHKPSVDVMFDSVSLLKLKQAYVLMTGMGSDGASAMMRVKQKNPAVITIAESKETCVVYGMPRVAAELGCVDHILPLHFISEKIYETSIQNKTDYKR